MGRGAKELREKLFVQGAEAWQRATGDDRAIYVCPLCGWGFTRIGLELNPPLLSLEDVPSRAVGGRRLVLTCRSCNSKAGHGVDKAVAAREEARLLEEALLRKKVSHSRAGRIELDGLETHADVNITPDSTTIVVPIERNDPKIREQQLKLWRERAAARQLKFNLSFSLSGYDERKARLGDLKAAYLAAFAVFGYNLALHPRMHIVRRQLWEPESLLITQAWLPNRKGRSGVCIMKQPVSCLTVSLRLYDVILPWINGPADVYSAVASAFDVDRFTATVVQYDWPLRPEMLIDFDPDVPVGSLTPPVSFENPLSKHLSNS